MASPSLNDSLWCSDTLPTLVRVMPDSPRPLSLSKLTYRQLYTQGQISMKLSVHFTHFDSSTMTSKWARWHLKSPASRMFTQLFIQRVDQRKHQSSASLAFLRGIHRSPVNSPHKGQLRGKCFHLMTSSFHGIWICLQNVSHLVQASVCYNTVTIARSIRMYRCHCTPWRLLEPCENKKQFSGRLSVYIIHLYSSSYYENRELSWCRLFRHWWRRSLSLRQPSCSRRSQNLHHGHVHMIYLPLAMIWPNVASINFTGWPSHIFAKRYIDIIFSYLPKTAFGSVQFFESNPGVQLAVMALIRNWSKL